MAVLTIPQLLEKFGPGDAPRSNDYIDLINTLADDRNAVYFSATAPTDTDANPLWFDTSNNLLFIYNGEWVESSGSGGASITVSDNAPLSPEEGALWYDSSSAKSYIYYDSFWVELAPATQGNEGAQGPSGIVSVAAPITNSGTSTEAIIGIDLSSYYTSSQTDSLINTAVANLVDSAPGTLDTLNELASALGDDPNFATTITNSIATKAPLSNPTFTGTVTASSFSGAATGLTGTAASLEAGSLSGGSNITTYVNGTLIPANTNTKIARLQYPNGMYAINIYWSGGYNSSGGTIYWESSYAGITGIASASGSGYYFQSPVEQLVVTGTQHHRNVNAPTFYMGPDELNGDNYGYLTLFINLPQDTSFAGFRVVVKQLNRI